MKTPKSEEIGPGSHEFSLIFSLDLGMKLSKGHSDQRNTQTFLESFNELCMTEMYLGGQSFMGLARGSFVRPFILNHFQMYEIAKECRITLFS